MIADMAARMPARMAVLGLRPVDVARAANLSPQRFGNYIHGVRPPDLSTLVRLARALTTTPDYLLGFEDETALSLSSILVRILELEGMPANRVKAAADTFEQARSLLRALPAEGDVEVRCQIAAQAAWQLSRQKAA